MSVRLRKGSRFVLLANFDPRRVSTEENGYDVATTKPLIAGDADEENGGAPHASTKPIPELDWWTLTEAQPRTSREPIHRITRRLEAAMSTMFMHMDKQYLWRWFCADDEGNIIAKSAQAYFRLADASEATQRFRQSILKS